MCTDRSWPPPQPALRPEVVLALASEHPHPVVRMMASPWERDLAALSRALRNVVDGRPEMTARADNHEEEQCQD